MIRSVEIIFSRRSISIINYFSPKHFVQTKHLLRGTNYHIVTGKVKCVGVIRLKPYDAKGVDNGYVC